MLDGNTIKFVGTRFIASEANSLAIVWFGNRLLYDLARTYVINRCGRRKRGPYEFPH